MDFILRLCKSGIDETVNGSLCIENPLHCVRLSYKSTSAAVERLQEADQTWTLKGDKNKCFSTLEAGKELERPLNLDLDQLNILVRDQGQAEGVQKLREILIGTALLKSPTRQALARVRNSEW